MGEDDIEERSEVCSGLVEVQRGGPGSSIDVDNWELNLIFGGPKIQK